MRTRRKLELRASFLWRLRTPAFERPVSWRLRANAAVSLDLSRVTPLSLFFEHYCAYFREKIRHSSMNNRCQSVHYKLIEIRNKSWFWHIFFFSNEVRKRYALRVSKSESYYVAHWHRVGTENWMNEAEVWEVAIDVNEIVDLESNIQYPSFSSLLLVSCFFLFFF